MNSFTGNATSGNGEGGAIYSVGNLAISGGTNSFTGNSAGQGGAIYSTSNLTVSGGTHSFTGNSATNGASGLGGAIFANMDANLTADGGDLTFRGNTANNLPNALYMANSDGNRSITLAATSGRSIFFYDPIASSDLANLDVFINNGGATGTVLFDKYRSDIYANTTLYNGTLQLTGGATYGVLSAPDTAFAAQSGSNIAADAAGNTISAANIALNAGSRITADLSGAAAGSTTNLTLDGTVTTPGGAITVDALNAGAVNGRYLLINNAGGFAFSSANVTVLVAGTAAPLRRFRTIYSGTFMRNYQMKSG